MGLLVLIMSVGAMLFPTPLQSIGTWVISPLLGLIMFGMGLTLSAEDFKVVISRPKDIVLGCLAQFTIMPIMAYVLAKGFSLSPELALGVILVGCCPGGTASNVICYLANGDLALSVGMTACSTLLAPIITPLLVWIFAGTFVDVDAIGMLLSIVYVVIAPIVAGLLCQHYMPKATHRVVGYLPAFSTLMITLVVGIIVSHNASKLLSGGLVVLLVVALHNLSGLFLGYGIGYLMHLSPNKRTAISIEVGMQNSGLASSLAVIHFATYPMATIPGAIFSVWHNISGALAAKWFTGTQKG